MRGHDRVAALVSLLSGLARQVVPVGAEFDVPVTPGSFRLRSATMAWLKSRSRFWWVGTRAGSAAGWPWSRSWPNPPADLRLGLLSATAARWLVKLPAGHQPEVLATLHRDELTAAELEGVVNLLGATPGRSQEYTLAQPRQALQQDAQETGWAYDPRLSRPGNRVARRLASVLDGRGHLETWLHHQDRTA